MTSNYSVEIYEDFVVPLNFTLKEWQKEQLAGLAVEGVYCLVRGWAFIEAHFTEFQEPYCKAVWDNHTCWGPTMAGEVTTRPCSEAMSSNLDIPGNAFRLCSDAGEWEEGDYWTNYTECYHILINYVKNLKEGEARHKFAVACILFVGSIISLACLTAALFTFVYFTIRSNRITVLNHFMLALALKCIPFIIMTAPPVFGVSNDYLLQNWICKSLVGLQIFASLASVNWMFVQGHFLNSRLTTNVFGRSFPIKVYIGFGWGFSLITIVSWISVMEIVQPDDCWTGYSDMTHVWIIVAPMLGVLLINVLFLGNVIRILWTRSHLTHGRADVQFRQALKATLLLFPLLGLNILLFFYNPGGEYKYHYMLINSILHSSQGMLVSIIGCFMTYDVRNAIRRAWARMFMKRGALSRQTIHSSSLAVTQL